MTSKEAELVSKIKTEIPDRLAKSFKELGEWRIDLLHIYSPYYRMYQAMWYLHDLYFSIDEKTKSNEF